MATELEKQLAEALRHIENAATDLRVRRYEIRAAASQALAALNAQQAAPMSPKPVSGTSEPAQGEQG